jgi:hypothetical protein
MAYLLLLQIKDKSQFNQAAIINLSSDYEISISLVRSELIKI